MAAKKTELARSEPAALDTSPQALLAQAVANGADISVLERLADLAERFQAAEAKKAFNRALSAAQEEIGTVVKTEHVSYKTTHYRYEDLAVVVEQIRPVMHKHGLSHRWYTAKPDNNGCVSVTCVITHADGHQESTTLEGPYDTSGGKNAIQSIGSVTSYLQRYTLKCALGIAAAKDDDGQQSPAPAPQRPQEANAGPSRASTPKKVPKDQPRPKTDDTTWPKIWEALEYAASHAHDVVTEEQLKKWMNKLFGDGMSGDDCLKEATAIVNVFEIQLPRLAKVGKFELVVLERRVGERIDKGERALTILGDIRIAIGREEGGES